MQRSESEAILGRENAGGRKSPSATYQQVIECQSTKSEHLKVYSAEGYCPVAKWRVEHSLGQCGLRTIVVTERPVVPECGRAPKYQSREVACKDGAKEWALSLGLP